MKKRGNTRPYYASPWPLKGELQVLAFTILAVIFVAVFVLVLLTGCRPILKEPPPQEVGEVQISCYDFTQTDPAKREFPCPSST